MLRSSDHFDHFADEHNNSMNHHHNSSSSSNSCSYDDEDNIEFSSVGIQQQQAVRMSSGLSLPSATHPRAPYRDHTEEHYDNHNHPFHPHQQQQHEDIPDADVVLLDFHSTTTNSIGGTSFPKETLMLPPSENANGGGENSSYYSVSGSTMLSFQRQREHDEYIKRRNFLFWSTIAMMILVVMLAIAAIFQAGHKSQQEREHSNSSSSRPPPSLSQQGGGSDGVGGTDANGESGADDWWGTDNQSQLEPNAEADPFYGGNAEADASSTTNSQRTNGVRWTQRGNTITGPTHPSSLSTSNRFGHLVALSRDGNILAVAVSVQDEYETGSSSSSSPNNNAISAVYVYVWNDMTRSWKFQQRLEPPAELVRAQYGQNSAPTTTLPGLYADETYDSFTMSADGSHIAFTMGDAILIFATLADNPYYWEELGAPLYPWNSTTNNAQNDHLTRLALSANGRVLVVRGTLEPITDTSATADSDTALVRIYVQSQDGSNSNSNSGSSSQVWQQLTGSDLQLKGIRGDISVSADGKRIAVSTSETDGPEATLDMAGRVIVYDWVDVAGWTPVGGQSRDDDSGLYGGLPYQRFGEKLNLSGNSQVLAVSTFKDRLVKVFQYDSTRRRWVPLGQTLQGINLMQQFGSSIQLNYDGTLLVVGAPGTPKQQNLGNNNYDESGYGKYRYGAIHVYHYSSSNQLWQELVASDSGTLLTSSVRDDMFGAAVAISLDSHTVAVGAPLRPSATIPNTLVGATAVFDWNL